MSKLDTLRTFFPFGGDSNINRDDENDFPTDTSGVLENVPHLRKISTEPVAGYTIYATTTFATSTETKITKNVFRFIQKATGHIFDVYEDMLVLERVSNTTIPRVHEAEFLTPQRLVIRYLKEDNQTIETYLAGIKQDEGGNEFGLDGIYLPQNITDIAVSPNGNLFYLEESANGSFGTTFDLKTNKSERIFESPLKEWEFGWPSENKIIYFTRPSANVAGFVYSLDVRTGNTAKIFGGIQALSALASPSGSRVLYSDNNSGRISLREFNLAGNSYSDKSVSTLAEKCVWSGEVIYCAVPATTPTGNLPDNWYQGKTYFSDNVWQLDSASDSVTLLSNLSTEAGEDIDAVNLKVSADGEYLLFSNKRDGSLWSLRLESSEI